jgi:hypothetical protein
LTRIRTSPEAVAEDGEGGAMLADGGADPDVRTLVRAGPDVHPDTTIARAANAAEQVRERRDE